MAEQTEKAFRKQHLFQNAKSKGAYHDPPGRENER
jgi:hypothetical protein